MDANDHVDARAWVRHARSGLATRASSQRFERADRFERTTLDLLEAGDVDEAVGRMDALVDLLAGDERGLDAMGVGLVETVFQLGLASEAVVRALEARADRPGWHSVLVSSWPAWESSPMSLPGIDREARALTGSSGRRSRADGRRRTGEDLSPGRRRGPYSGDRPA